MKQSEFSEKFFEFASNHELLNRYKVDIYIPSQYEEDDLGWDIGFTDYVQLYFFQYKIVRQYIRNPKSLIGDSFKFQLHMNSKGVYKQHKLLEYLNRMGFIARYVVPNYIEMSTLKSLLYSSTVFTKVKFIIPNPLSSKKSHYINFDSTNVFQHSKEQERLQTSTHNDIFTYEGVLSLREWDKDKIFLLDFIKEDTGFMNKNHIENPDTLINKYLFDNKIIMFALKEKIDE